MVFVLLLPSVVLGANRGVYYEVFIRAFADSNGDGQGDLNGLRAKLPYLKDMGISGLWLMPIFPSKSYHGYDVTDYRDINPEYGTMEDFKALLKEAHALNISVLLDIPFNHTSKNHPWFIESRDKNSQKRSWYHWADEGDEKVKWNSKAWIKSGDSYYYALFWEGMPDLNFDNPEVRAEVLDISKFWLKLGVDGFRLDATSHIYGTGETSQFQNIDKSADFWKEYYDKIKAEFPDSYIIGEAWENYQNRAKLLKGLDSALNFDIGEKLFSSIKNKVEGSEFVTTLSKLYATYNDIRKPNIDAPFLTNHDQSRAFSMSNYKENRARIAMQVLLTLPGNPFIYYGEEIGMAGAKPDEELRTPMLWGEDSLQTSWRSSKYNANTRPVDEQEKDEKSLLNAYKRWIHLRNQNKELLLGEFSENKDFGDELIAFNMKHENHAITVLHNISQNEISGECLNKYELVYADENSEFADGKYRIAPYSSMLLREKK